MQLRLQLLSQGIFTYKQPLPAQAAGKMVVLILIGGLFSVITGQPAAYAQKVVPRPGFIYHAAFPDFGGPEDKVTLERITKFEDLAGKKIAWAYFSNNWWRRIKYPQAAINTIHSHGSVPFVRLMARSKFGKPRADKRYRLRKILSGKFDRAISAWADAAAASGIPMMVEFGSEVNGFWVPWNGKWNGRGRKKRYGDPHMADGPERFRDAYRHIVDIFRARGANNVTWVFHVNAISYPNAKWNTIKAYYPGDDYVDWIGVSVYGALNASEAWLSFTEVLDQAYPQLVALSADKPLALLEFGVDERRHNPSLKAAWISEAINSIASGRYPRIRAISYWHENWRNAHGVESRLHINSSPEALAAYRSAVANSIFTSSVKIR
ncbi:MAG: beta-mannanase [Candidatus Dadabacteria bacterium]|nr:MAG: beta-mannanase [Candidatus Dadabacteria bacterium]